MTPADLPAVLAIQAGCHAPSVHESHASLRAKLAASPATCLVASIGDDDRAVGYLIALPWEHADPPALNAATCALPSAANCLYLHDLAVTPHARQAGAGRLLVETFLLWLKQSGLGRASLVAVQNSAPFWERHGFRAVPPSAALEPRLATYGSGVQYMERAA
jgi:GNAT superfamily N-acetyltransferase